MEERLYLDEACWMRNLPRQEGREDVPDSRDLQKQGRDIQTGEQVWGAARARTINQHLGGTVVCWERFCSILIAR